MITMKFAEKMRPMMDQLKQNKIRILYVQFKCSTYGIFKSRRGKFHIKYYKPPEVYISKTQTVYYPGSFIDEVHSLSIDKVINWFIKNYQTSIANAKFYSK